MLHHLGWNIVREILQRIDVLLVPLVGGDNSDRLVLRLLLGIDLRLIKQEAQLLHGILRSLFRGCSEPLVPDKAQRLGQNRYLLLQFGNAFLLCFVFRAGNGDHFGVACLEIFRTFHGSIIPYMCQKVQ